jgi:serine O-acetyltransferase
VFSEPAPLSEVAEHTLGGFAALVRADADQLRRRMGRLGPFVYPSLTATVLYRVSRVLRLRRRRRTARAVMWLNMLLTGAELEPISVIGPGLVLAHTRGVLVGQGTRVGRNLFIHSGVVLGSVLDDRTSGFPTIGDDVTVYTKASVIGPISVGDRATIGAHALVLDDVPAGMVARGVPARSHQPRDVSPAPRSPSGAAG